MTTKISNVFCHNRFLALLTLGIFVLQTNSIAFAHEDRLTICELREVNLDPLHRRLDLKIGTQNIVLLGWNHLNSSAQEMQIRSSRFFAAVAEAKKNDCNASFMFMQELVERERRNVEAGRNLFERLQQISEKRRFIYLGIESTLKMYPQMKSTNQLAEADLAIIKTQCPKLAGFTEDFSFIAPGPEYLWSQATNKVARILPLENQELRDKASKIRKELDLLPPVYASDLPPEARAKYLLLMQHFQLGVQIQDSEIHDLSQILDGKGYLAAAAVQSAIILQKLLAFNPLRNAKMADAITASHANSIVVLGNSHIEDLGRQLLNRCEHTKSTNKF